MSLGVLNQSIVELHKRMQPRDWDPDEKLERAARKEKVKQRLAEKKAKALAGEVTAETPDGIKSPEVKAPEVKVETVKRYSVDDLRANPDKIYIYGDNLERIGKKNQSIIRDEPNAFGIATKKSPHMGESAFFTDDEFEANKKIIDADIAAIKADGRTIVLPEDGIGTGLASLKNRAPKTFAYLQEQLDALKGETSKSKIKIFYPFKPEEPGRTHANWFIEFMEETQPDKEIIMVDNPRDADFIMARHFKDTPSSKLMGNPFGHQSSGGNQIVTTKNLDETEKLYKAWLRGEEIPNITDEQKKQLDVIRKGLDKKIPTFQPGSLGAAKVYIPETDKPVDLNRLDELENTSMEDIDAKIEGDYDLPKGTLNKLIGDIPGAVIVPFEQALELTLRKAGYGGRVQKLIKYELRVFALSIAGGILGTLAKYGTNKFGADFATAVWSSQAGVVPSTGNRITEMPETNIEEEANMMMDAAVFGSQVMGTIIKAMPSYWLDEWLLKRYPELEENYDEELSWWDNMKQGGWKGMFPQQGVLTEKLYKPSYDYLKGLSK